MIVTSLDAKHGSCSLILESAEDLWATRRLISKGDVVVTKTSRVVKREDEFSRPDKGERVKVTVSLKVDEVHLDSSIERLRVRGTILEASDETVTKTGSHTLTLSQGHSFTLHKEAWGPLQTNLVRPPESGQGFVIVAADRREAGVGTLRGSHLAVLTTIESGLGGKMSEEQSPRPYIAKVADTVGQSVREGDVVLVGGPGNFKNTIVNQLGGTLKPGTLRVLEGLDVTGSDGVRAAVKTRSFQEAAAGSRLVELQSVVNEAVRRISMGDGKVAYSLPRVAAAAEAGAVESIVVSDNAFSAGMDEESLVSVMNLIESRRGAVFLADSSTEAGMQVSSFGGVVALLRYAVTA